MTAGEGVAGGEGTSVTGAMAPAEGHDEQLIAGLSVALAQHGDADRRQQAVALFAQDATWLRAGRLRTGPAEIAESYAELHDGAVVRHHLGGTTVQLLGSDRASALTYYLAFRYQPLAGESVTLPAPLLRPFTMGEWHDEFVRAVTRIT